MQALNDEFDAASVFLNVPFDDAYEKLFLALIACVVTAGLKPRCALELPERGQGQLDRIIAVMQSSGLSIHDLSRPRGNMPLELGYWMGLNHFGKSNRGVIVLCASLRPFEQAYSDLRRLRPIVHAHGPLRLIRELADNLDGLEPGPAERVYRTLTTLLPDLKGKRKSKTCFTRKMFDDLCEKAREAAAL